MTEKEISTWFSQLACTGVCTKMARGYPKLILRPDDLVAYVSFHGLAHPVAVPAKLLRMRVMADEEHSYRGLAQFKTLPPERRREVAQGTWERCRPAVERMLGCPIAAELWTPAEDRCELLSCPDIQLGRGRTVTAPCRATVDEYERYYRQRLDKLRGGGLYYYPEAVERKLFLVTPRTRRSWTEALQTTLLGDFTRVIQDISGARFSLSAVREDDPERIIEVLGRTAEQQGGPGTAVVVFDEQSAGGAAYYLLSHELSAWHLKRLTKGEVLRKWNARQTARDVQGRCKAERRWQDMVTLSVIDTLDQMGAIPWRIGDWPYEACLAIDVGEGRRHFAMSVVICRGPDRVPALARISESWPKGDHQRESINPVILRDKIVQTFGGCDDPDFAPLRSLLILRDGRVCEGEGTALDQAIDRLRQKGRLEQRAPVDVAEVHKKTAKHLRMWLPTARGCANVLEGQTIYLDGKTALLTCTGAATVSRTATADPCLLVLRRGQDIRPVARGFFALAQLNYTSPSKAQRLAHPLRETDARLQQRMAEDMRGIK
jgi:hypothetical protein